MGSVLRATDLRLRRRVALKFLSNWDSVTEEGRQRFEREAFAVAKLDHPNIAPIHGVEQDASGQMFLVMPCCDGGSLAERLRRQRLSPEEALSIAISTARGLVHAHSRGIVHRDIK